MKTLIISGKDKIALPKELRIILNLYKGDNLSVSLKDRKFILEPIIGVPHSQAWFWTSKVQEKIKASERDFKRGCFSVVTMRTIMAR